MKRIHISDEKILEVFSIRLQTLNVPYTNYLKPRGLWYAFDGTTWKNWVKKNMNRPMENVQKTEIPLHKGVLTRKLHDAQKDKILQIKTFRELEAFHAKYGYTPQGFLSSQLGKNLMEGLGKRHHFIKWDVVMQDFGGIEIFVDPRIIREKCFKRSTIPIAEYYWFDTFDIPSGVIWSAHLIDIPKKT